MVHEGVRKKCSICHKVLSDLNKHMRTVHGTYRRRAKIPKELIGEMDDPDTDLTPQIYGSSQARDDQDLDSEPDEDQDCDNEEKPGPVIKVEPPSHIPSAEPATLNIPNFPMKTETNLPEMPKFQLKDDRSTETIKEELGLSSGITLQKIVRPTKSPPKLLYCGPKELAVTPLPPSSTTPLSITPLLVQKPPETTTRTETQSSNMVKITGKFSRKITELLPLKKTVQNV